MAVTTQATSNSSAKNLSASTAPSVLLTYRYEAIPSHENNLSPSRQKGFLQAKNERDARLQLRKKNLIATHLKLVTQHHKQRDILWNPIRTRLYHAQHVALICHTIEDALNTGQTLVSALHTAERIAPSDEWELAIIQLRQQLLSGLPVSGVLVDQKKHWGKTLCELLIASDQANRLVEGFYSAAQLSERQHYWYTQWQANYWRGIGWLALMGFVATVWWLTPISINPPSSPLVSALFAGIQWCHTISHQWLWPILTIGAILTWLGITFPRQFSKSKTQLGKAFAITRSLWQKHQTCLWVGHWWAGLKWQYSPQESFKLACGLASNTETQRTLGHVLTQLEHGYPLADAIDDVPHIHPHIRLAVRLATNQEDLQKRLWHAWDTIMMEQATALKMLWITIQWLASGACIWLLLDIMLFHHL